MHIKHEVRSLKLALAEACWVSSVGLGACDMPERNFAPLREMPDSGAPSPDASPAEASTGQRDAEVERSRPTSTGTSSSQNEGTEEGEEVFSDVSEDDLAGDGGEPLVPGLEGGIDGGSDGGRPVGSNHGECSAREASVCDPYACEEAVCRVECRHDGHCAAGASCASGRCIRYGVKQISITSLPYVPGGGVAGADAHCQAEFGEDGTLWKALLVGGGRVATSTPNLGDGQSDWVVHPYTRYYNWEGRLLWVTEEIALLGVRGGQRVEMEQAAWSHDSGSYYPWSGYANDWTTRDGEHCNGWTSNDDELWGAFAFQDLTHAALEPCDRAQFLMCVEQ